MNKLSINNKGWQNIAGLIVIAMFFIGDRILKQLALDQGYGQSTAILGDWLQFRLVFNPNIAFSLPLSGNLLLLIATLMIAGLIFAIIYLIINKKYRNGLILPLTFILFGAISNLLDRYLYGAVVDYFDLRYFTILNLADTMISIGVIIILINNIANSKKIWHGPSDYKNSQRDCCDATHY